MTAEIKCVVNNNKKKKGAEWPVAKGLIVVSDEGVESDVPIHEDIKLALPKVLELAFFGEAKGEKVTSGFLLIKLEATQTDYWWTVKNVRGNVLMASGETRDYVLPPRRLLQFLSIYVEIPNTTVEGALIIKIDKIRTITCCGE